MPQTVKINDRGLLTLPADIRKQYHLKGGDLLIVEPTAHGILLRPALPIPIQFFNDAQVKAMERELAAELQQGRRRGGKRRSLIIVASWDYG